MSAIGDRVYGRFPGHGVEWSEKSGWHQHLEVRDGAGRRTEKHPAVPATEGKLIELHEDGSATIEVLGPWLNDGTREFERVRVPDREHAEWHTEAERNSVSEGRTAIGPHWIPA